MSSVATYRTNRVFLEVVCGGCIALGALSPSSAAERVSLSGPAKQAAAAAKTATVQLTVHVTNLRNAQGQVAVALFHTADSFPDQDKALAGQVATIEGSHATLTFPGLKPGVYAAAMLHDENKNNKMDFNFLGMPVEGYGFSNDAAATFGPPSFAEAAFRLKATDSRIALKAQYFL